ncbi:MAG: molybdopterin molybdotransferase MoeA [Anaerolineae bacterium]
MEQREGYAVLSVEDARERILSGMTFLGSECVPLAAALGRVLAEDIVAGEDIPPLANSAMDGYALRSIDTISASASHLVELKVLASLPAGQVYGGTVGSGQAIRIMTGAPLPAGADAVVRFEDAEHQGEQLVLHAPVRFGLNVRTAGEDVRRGQQVLAMGTLIRAQEIGLLAGLGINQVPVGRRPLVAILATGDEIAASDISPNPGQIRNINGPMNAAQVRQAGGVPLELGVARDSTHELGEKIRQGLDAGAHLFITSGGVSAGDFDLVKRVLASVGSLDFWWVNMKPGRPLAFGHLGAVPLLALPGNPVAAFVSFELFARPAIMRLQGFSSYQHLKVQARLVQPIGRKDGRRHYLRVRLAQTSDGLVAELTGDQGSGIITSLVQADGLAVIPETCDHLAAGSMVEVLLLR